MSILSGTLADEVKLSLVDATIKHPWLWSWIKHCVTINVMNVLLNRVWSHGPVKMYPKDHIRKVFYRCNYLIVNIGNNALHLWYAKTLRVTSVSVTV